MLSNPRSLRDAPPIVLSTGVLALVITCCFVMAWMAVPTKDEIVARMALDGRVERAAQIASDADASADQKTAATAWSAVESWQALRGTVNALPSDQRRQLLLDLLKGSITEKSPATADEILNHHASDLARLTDSQAQQMITSLWQGGLYEKAITWLEERMAQTDKALPAELQTTYISLLFESNQPSKALSAWMPTLLARAQSGDLPLADVNRAVQMAEFSSRTPEVLPLLSRWLAESAFMQGTLDDFCQSAPPQADVLKLAKKAAQWNEWHGNPTAALPIFLRLASCGDEEALTRCIHLYAPLRQPQEMLLVLNALAAKKQMPAVHEYARAQLLAQCAHDEEAALAYQAYLKDHPNNQPAWYELSALYDDMGRNEEAYAACRNAGNDPTVLKRAAALACNIGRFADAIALYQTLSPDQHDSTSIENYALLSESLADNTNLHRALGMRIDRLENPTAGDFLDLARSQHLLGKEFDRIETLQKGLAALPRHGRLVRAAVECLMDLDRCVEAAHIVEAQGSLDDPRQVALYIEASSRSTRGSRALAYLSHLSEQSKTALPADTLIHLARLHAQAGRQREADSILAAVPVGPVTFALQAETKFEQGDYSGAAELQQQHLATIGDSAPDAWMFLGEIERAAGRNDAATAAFDRALTIIRRKAQTPVQMQIGSTTARLEPTAIRPTFRPFLR